jgi:2-methylaconitate cis-trans-isomerase PrpF
MKKIKCAVIRGGTSKGVFFHEQDLPSDLTLRDRTLLSIMGSPDKRQINGLGGADLTTSKVVIIRPSKREDADVDYMFGQVSLTTAEIDWTTICGNLSAAVGPFAIDEGLVTPQEPVTRININCPVTGKIIRAEVPVANGKAAVLGDFSISGVPGTGARIGLDYADTAGGLAGALLPSGNAKDILNIDGLGSLEVSIVDCGNLMVFVRARDLALENIQSPLDIDNSAEIVRRIEIVRRAAAEKINMAQKFGWDKFNSPLMPIMGIVKPPSAFINYATGEEIKPGEMDLFAILYTAGMTHKAYSGTTTACTGAAYLTKGTIVNELVAAQKETLYIGHPCGTIPVSVRASGEPEAKIEKVVFYRTARRIMDGYAYVHDEFR